MKRPLINHSLLFKRQACGNAHAVSFGQLVSAATAMTMLVGMLTLGSGCGKKEEPAPVSPPQTETVQPAASAPVQRQQYAAPPPPSAPARPTNQAYPAGAPMTRPAGASKPVPVVP